MTITYLDGVDEVLGVCLELPLALAQLVWAGRHHTPGPNGSFRNISGIMSASITTRQGLSSYPLAIATR